MIDAREISVVLLAAGRSHRFGEDDKLLAQLDGDPLVLHAARRIVELEPGRRIAVCNDAASDVSRLLDALGFEIVLNPHPESGLSYSLACGIAAVAQGPAQAALLCLADMPFVSLGHLRALLTRFDPAHAPVVASAKGDVAMPPALFARSLFDRLQSGQGDQGARALLAGSARVTGGRDELADVDLPEHLPSTTGAPG